MLFHSLDFFVFIIVFFIFWPFFRKNKNPRFIYIVVASFVFYGWWDWRFLFLILACGINVFFSGLAMQRFPDRKKVFLIVSVVINVGLLCVFKYLDFLLANINGLLAFIKIDFGFNLPHLPLPVGISFFTFQAMSYSIDVYKKDLEPTNNIFHLFAYLSMFPQLVAGPIVRAKDLLVQLKEYKPIDDQKLWNGAKLIVIGYFCKVVVADNLAVFINMAFSQQPLRDSSIYWWTIIIMFAVQIYCDFSGYSKIARGLGIFMGYNFPVNFNHPYISKSFREFWSRWHISLSTWFRDYIYIPLGGSRKGKLRNHINLWITMLISGLWHGASWAFIFWAALHSLYMSVERITRWPKKLCKFKIGRPLAILIVFVLTNIAWIFFRAQTFGQAFQILCIMFSFKNISVSVIINTVGYQTLILLLVMFLWELFSYLKLGSVKIKFLHLKNITELVLVSLMIAACVLLRGKGNEFIYFQF